MKKHLSDLTRIDIHKLVNEDGHWQRDIMGYEITLVPEQFNSAHFLQLFVNQQRQQKQWFISSRPHKGWLRHNGHIKIGEVWYVVGSNNKRYRYLFIDGLNIGTRAEFFKNTWQMYRHKSVKKGDGGLHDQAKQMEKKLFTPTDEWEKFHRATELRYRLKGI